MKTTTFSFVIVIFLFVGIIHSQNKQIVSEIIQQQNISKLLVNAMEYDGMNNLYVLSSTDNNKMKLGEGVFCYYLSKYDNTGHLVFQKQFGAAPHGGAELGITQNNLPFVIYNFMYYEYFYLFSQAGDSLLWLNGGEGNFFYSLDKGNIYLYSDGRIEIFTLVSNEGKIVKNVETLQFNVSMVIKYCFAV